MAAAAAEGAQGTGGAKAAGPMVQEHDPEVERVLGNPELREILSDPGMQRVMQEAQKPGMPVYGYGLPVCPEMRHSMVYYSRVTYLLENME